MDKGKKKYTLRNKTFQIEANDRLQFMVDCRELYNQVAEDCFPTGAAQMKQYRKDVAGDIAFMRGSGIFGEKQTGWVPFTSMEKLLEDARDFGRGK